MNKYILELNDYDYRVLNAISMNINDDFPDHAKELRRLIRKIKDKS